MARSVVVIALATILLLCVCVTAHEKTIYYDDEELANRVADILRALKEEETSVIPDAEDDLATIDAADDLTEFDAEEDPSTYYPDDDSSPFDPDYYASPYDEEDYLSPFHPEHDLTNSLDTKKDPSAYYPESAEDDSPFDEEDDLSAPFDEEDEPSTYDNIASYNSPLLVGKEEQMASIMMKLESVEDTFSENELELLDDVLHEGLSIEDRNYDQSHTISEHDEDLHDTPVSPMLTTSKQCKGCKVSCSRGRAMTGCCRCKCKCTLLGRAKCRCFDH